MDKTPLPGNTIWGFWAVIAESSALAAWTEAIKFIKSLEPIVDGKEVTDDEIRGFLETTHGRRLGVSVLSQGGIEKVHARWPITGSFFKFDLAVREYRLCPW